VKVCPWLRARPHPTLSPSLSLRGAFVHALSLSLSPPSLSLTGEQGAHTPRKKERKREGDRERMREGERERKREGGREREREREGGREREKEKESEKEG